MRRFLVTLVTISTMAVAFRVYSAIVLPMVATRASNHPLSGPLESDIRLPAIFEQQAVKVFPEVPWTHHAAQTWQMAEHAYLYFSKHLRVPGDGRTLQVSPVALFYQDPKRPDAKPFRILAERAQLKFQNSFFDTAISMTDANPGRIVWASLEGKVHIDGPDGLSIDGENFKFDEDSAQLYSDHNIAFKFGPTAEDQRRISGTADQMQLTFAPSHESAFGKDMPRVGELVQLLLRRNVVLDITYEQRGKEHFAHIQSAGSFFYDLIKREATLDDRVRVSQISRKNGIDFKDAIDCAWMRLQFDPSPASQNHGDRKTPGTFDGLVFRSMRAQGSDNGRGSRIKVTSDEQQLAAVMQDLTYDAIKRRAVLIDQEQVVVHRGNAKFVCPQIGIQHSATNQLEYLECRGPGQMNVSQEKADAPPVMARWGQKVQVSPDPESGVHLIRIDERAQLGIPGQFDVIADVLRLWVDLDRLPNQNQSMQQNGQKKNVLARALPLKRARAEGHVQLNSKLLRVTRSNLIDAVIHPGVIREEATMQNPAGSSGESSSEPSRDDPWDVEGDTLNIDLVHDSGSAALDVRQVNGVGHILVRHDSNQNTKIGDQSINGPFVLKGESVVAHNGGGIQQVITVRGEVGPKGEILKRASVGLGAAKLWGGLITFSRHENRVDVPGPGGLSVPIPNQTQNDPTSPPVATTESRQMDIVWEEGMTFDGLSARFWGNVTTAVPGEQQSLSRLLCEDLTATLNQKISFADPNQRNGELTISHVDARHHVVVEGIEYAQNHLSAVRRSELAGFQVDLETGDFLGDGPGIIHSWSLGDAVKFSPGESPQANQPVKTPNPKEDRWRYSNVRFSGKIDGNMNRSDATLSERVEVLTAPVEKALAKFQRGQLSDQTPEAENAVWMKCDQMRIIQKQFGDQPEKFYEVFATGGTELEGHAFRAVADELTFDERRGQFILRGLGKEARLYYQAEPGQAVSPSAARLIEFVPSKRKITIDGATGISGSY